MSPTNATGPLVGWASRFSRTPGRVQRPAPVPGQDTDAALADWGFTEAEIAELHAQGPVASIPD